MAGLAVLVQPGGLLASATLLTMQICATFSPEAAQERLTRLRAWMESHQDRTVVTLSLLVGLWLVGRSIDQLVG